MTIDLTTPAAQMARYYMRDVKGIHVEPHDVDKLADQETYYFYYRLPQGVLELEVAWNLGTSDWDIMVTAFPAKLG